MKCVPNRFFHDKVKCDGTVIYLISFKILLISISQCQEPKSCGNLYTCTLSFSLGETTPSHAPDGIPGVRDDRLDFGRAECRVRPRKLINLLLGFHLGGRKFLPKSLKTDVGSQTLKTPSVPVHTPHASFLQCCRFSVRFSARVSVRVFGLA